MPLSITPQLLIKEAEKHGISHKVVSEKHNLVLFEYEGKTSLTHRSRIPATSGAFSLIADTKGATYDLMDFYGFSYPKTFTTDSLEAAKEFVKEIKFPVVVKPEEGAYGNGVTTNIQNFEDFEKAFNFAKIFNEDEIIIQDFVEGEDFRILVVGFKVIAISQRIPARVFGDGKNTIAKLIEIENQNPLREKGHQKPLTIIEIDHELKTVLEEHRLSLESIPKDKEEVRLRRLGNLSKGGEAEDITEQVPQENIKLFEEMAQALDANIVGIDIRTEDITKVLNPEDYAVIEVNACPGIRMHEHPSKGKPKKVAKAILQVMFPNAF